MRWNPRWCDRLFVLAALVLVSVSAGPTTLRAAAPAPAANASAAVSPVPPAQTVSLRYGSPGAITDAGLFIARARGYFAQQGIDLEMVPFQTGPDAIPLMATGEMDAAAGTHSIALLNAAERGLGVRIVAGKGVSRPAFEFTHLVVRRDLIDSGAVRDWPDLRGRVLAIPPGRPGGGDYQVARGLTQAGLSIQDVDLVELPFPDMVPALGNRTIVASYTTEPLATLAADRGVAVKWRNVGEWLPGSGLALLTYGPSMLELPPDVGQRFLVAYLRGARDYNTAFWHGVGRAEVVQILANSTTVKDAALYDRMGMSGIDPDGEVNMASLADQAAYYAEQGVMPAGVDLRPLIDERFREVALQRLGPYRAS
jgi:NitT/TauT family transport system substrate-binding protein